MAQDNIPQFNYGPKGAVNKLNRVVGAVNDLRSIRGDENFIAVKRSANSGVVVSLNINQVLSRIPKFQTVAGFWAKITGNAGSSTPYTYSWFQMSGLIQGAGALGAVTGPLALSGSTSVNPAFNMWEYSDAGADANPVPANTIVWMEQDYSADSPSHATWRFEFIPLVSVGKYCDSATPIYTDHANITHINFQFDDFDTELASGSTTRIRVTTVGFSVFKKPYSGSNITACGIKILQLVDAAFGGAQEPSNPDFINPITPPTTDFVDEYSVYFTLNDTTAADPCASCSLPATKNTAQISGNVYIPTCQYLPTIQDCIADHDGTFSCTKTIQFARGFHVTGNPSTQDGKAVVTLGLAIDPSCTSFMQLIDDDDPDFGDACGYYLKLCTGDITPIPIELTTLTPTEVTISTVTVVTNIECNSSGMLDVTTQDIYTLGSAASLWTFADGTTYKVIPNTYSAINVLPSASSFKVIADC